MIEGVTKSGFKFAYDEKLMDDFEIVDAIADIISEEPSRLLSGLSTFVGKILGGVGKKELYDHIRTEDGRVPVAAVEAEVMEILTAGQNQTKKP